jgi:uncharacterized protein (DUF58 family)
MAAGKPEGRARLVLRPTPRLFVLFAFGIALGVLESTVPGLKGLGALVIVGALLIGMADAAYLAGGPQMAFEWGGPETLPAFRSVGMTLRFAYLGRSTRVCEIRALAPPEFDLQDEWWRGRLSRGSFGEWLFRVRPLKRGGTRLGPIYLSYRSPLGGVQWSGLIRSHLEVKVIPDVAALRDRLRMAVYEEAGSFSRRLLKLWEEGTVFESLREYQVGDDPRKMDWKATAKRNTLMVKKMEHEPDQRVWVLLDAGRVMLGRMGEKSRMDLAVEAGMQVAYAAAYLRDRVGLMAFDRELRVVIASEAGWGWVAGILRKVHDLEASRYESLYESATLRVMQMAKERSFVVLFSDLLDPVTSRRLIEMTLALATRHSVILCVFEDPALKATAEVVPATTHEAVRGVAAMVWLREREQVLERLRQAGVALVEAPAARLAVSALNAFLAARKTPL